MSDYIERAIQVISGQQKTVQLRGPQWMVGEQLKDICGNEPASAELIYQDLQVAELSIVEAEKKIKAYADAHKTGNFACVTPVEADRILREFYGLAKRPESRAAERSGEVKPTGGLNLLDFL